MKHLARVKTVGLAWIFIVVWIGISCNDNVKTRSWEYNRSIMCSWQTVVASGRHSNIAVPILSEN